MQRTPDSRLHPNRISHTEPVSGLPKANQTKKAGIRGFLTNGFTLGLTLTIGLAVVAKLLASIPYLTIMGQLVLAIVLGMIWRASIGVPERAAAGISFSSKKLLRVGIILLGMRLDWSDIAAAGPKAAAIAAINIAFALMVVYFLARMLGVESRLGMMTACGTAICGAAAVIAVSPQLKAKDEETAIAAATIAVLGTIFTLAYTFLYPVLGLSPYGYGVFAGGTLHEIAHAIAAAAPGGGEAVDTAVVVKLTRVAMLVPVAVLIGFWVKRKERREILQTERGSAGAGVEAEAGARTGAGSAAGPGAGTEARTSAGSVAGPKAEGSALPDGTGAGTRSGTGTGTGFWRSLPIPWFIFGFLAVSGLHSLDIVPQAAADLIVVAAYMLIASAMAGLGLNVDAAAFRRLGVRPLVAAFIGSLLLSGLGYALVFAFGMV
ncbi:YeiH family protein [Paenibacillus contaminans]|uniref:Putative sulfate exporter family transporter n=1 Tax=Paenibacillus contaminans TaxID=450362 RepID=A0A329MHQ9_9BACL|nr:putative sulfate exporter family transporter [Paenibacillus contaminans]RAV19290.1 putative sulfate exporter family transporter [Paenibacillus contaminans]